MVFGDGVTDIRLLEAFANADQSQLEMAMHNAITSIILTMVQKSNPHDCLILAVDGVGPAAKLQQQRGRREKAAREKSPVELFDRNAITPGTEFMINLDNFMLRFIATYRNILPPKIIYSSHLVPGEGEHKIMDMYRKGDVSDGDAAKNGGAHILYGLDADLIMLSLMAPIDNIYLSRETVDQSINIDEFKEYLMQQGELRGGKGSRPSSIDDFVVMMFLLGNDFLPHSPALEEMSETISALMDIYVNGDFVLTITDEYEERRRINWDNMKSFLQAVAGRENEFLAALSVKQYTYPSRFLQAALIDNKFHLSVFRSEWYKNALGSRGPKEFTSSLEQIIASYTPTDYDMITDPITAQTPITGLSPITPNKIMNMGIDYMRTMEWVYLYYREGTSAVNHDWAYPYHHTPMLTDLAATAQLVDVQFSIIGYESYVGMTPFTALHQLVAVLPLKSKDLLPLELQPLFGYNSVLRDLLPDNFIVELDAKNRYVTKHGKIVEPQGVPIVPFIDRNRIIDAVAQISFTPDRAKLWLPATEQIFTRTPEETEILARVQFDQKRKLEFEARQAEAAERSRQRREARQQQQQQVSPRGTRGRGRGRGRKAYTYIPRKEVDTYIPRKEVDTYIPRKEVDTYIPRKEVDTYRPRGEADIYRPGTRGADIYRPGTRGADTYRPGTRGADIYRPETREVDTYRPETREVDTYRPETREVDTYIPKPYGRGTRAQPEIRRPPSTVQTEIRRPPSTVQTEIRRPPSTVQPSVTQTNLPTITQLPQMEIPKLGETITRQIPKQGATLVPIGGSVIPNMPVGRGTSVIGRQMAVPQISTATLTPTMQNVPPVTPVTQVTRQAATSPAQWKQMQNLM
jgi:hypothetical protein